MCLYACICMCMCIYIYIYIYTIFAAAKERADRRELRSGGGQRAGRTAEPDLDPDPNRTLTLTPNS